MPRSSPAALRRSVRLMSSVLGRRVAAWVTVGSDERAGTEGNRGAEHGAGIHGAHVDATPTNLAVAYDPVFDIEHEDQEQLLGTVADEDLSYAGDIVGCADRVAIGRAGVCQLHSPNPQLVVLDRALHVRVSLRFGPAAVTMPARGACQRPVAAEAATHMPSGCPIASNAGSPRLNRRGAARGPARAGGSERRTWRAKNGEGKRQP